MIILHDVRPLAGKLLLKIGRFREERQRILDVRVVPSCVICVLLVGKVNPTTS